MAGILWTCRICRDTFTARTPSEAQRRLTCGDRACMRAWRRQNRKLLALVCANPDCPKPGRLFEVVPSLHDQKHCSVACANVGKMPPSKADADRGRALAGAAKRRATLAALDGLTPLEAFRRGYMNGLRSKLTQVRRKFELRPKIAATSGGIDPRKQTE